MPVKSRCASCDYVMFFLGDFRMVIGEDKAKVSNIVKENMEHFRILYNNILQECPQVVYKPQQGKLEVSQEYSIKALLCSSSPPGGGIDQDKSYKWVYYMCVISTHYTLPLIVTHINHFVRKIIFTFTLSLNGFICDGLKWATHLSWEGWAFPLDQLISE